MKKYLAAIAIIFLGFQSMAQNSESDSTRRALLKTLQQTKEDTNRVNAIIKYGDWWSKTNLDSALTCYLKAEKLGQKLKYVRGELKGLAAQSTIFVQKGKYNDAIEVTQRAMAIAEKKGSLRQKAVAAGNVGHAYVQSGKTMEAIPLLMKANTQLEQLHDSTSVCIFSANIAHVYADLKQYNICLSYVKKAYAFCKPNDTRQVATCLNNITQIYALLKNYKEAERYGTLALTKARESGALTPLCNALINMGTQVYLNTGRIPEAIALNDEALSIAKKLNYPDFQLGALEGLALGHFKLENYAKADFYLNEAISLVDSTEIEHEELGEIYQVKSQLDFIRKDYRSAYEALAKYSTINDTLTNLKHKGG
ncbi:tetratricopeptide repeat protein [Dyadobacter sp. CY312]|uniref:tetratricopeptide repeat protein n=1 Tax=Dyadobacter sp. CY312 TaxID=2907303 RepID=UPI001F27354D|nr:tetratricopeptide repeat protein [Dyadobacter sp. CY312]MCE7041912.1 tetratricopeptide repeat protein [Dyadobacter sp. CY312]